MDISYLFRSDSDMGYPENKKDTTGYGLVWSVNMYLECHESTICHAKMWFSNFSFSFSYPFS